MRASSLRRTVDSIEMASITAPAAGRLPRFAKLRTFPRHERTPPMTEPTTPAKVAMPLHWKIGIGFFLGLVLGLDRKSTTSELQSLMRISYAVFCLQNNNHKIK